MVTTVDNALIAGGFLAVLAELNELQIREYGWTIMIQQA